MSSRESWYGVRRRLESLLDSLFSKTCKEVTEYNSVLSREEIDVLGYGRNFPQLTCCLGHIPDSIREGLSSGQRTFSKGVDLCGMTAALLPAACYKVYLERRRSVLPSPVVLGCVAKCFRNEDKPLDRYRSLDFTMKEFVYLGTSNGAVEHLEESREIVSDLLQALGIKFCVETASDPFFDDKSSTARLAQLSPTKREFVYNGHALSSLNSHRNYFGEKFTISMAGKLVETSCVAFGIDRWLAMLEEHFITPGAAAEALQRVGSLR